MVSRFAHWYGLDCQVSARLVCRRAIVAFTVALLGTTPPPDNALASEVSRGRPWTVEDSVALTYFVANQNLPGYWGIESPVVASPDGNYFFVVRRRGDLARDCHQHQLDVYSIERLRRSLRNRESESHDEMAPLRSITLCSSSSSAARQAITDARWAADESAVLFAGVEGGGIRHAYALDIRTGTLRRLSEEAHEVSQFAAIGDSILYSVRRNRERDALNAYPMVALRDVDLQEAIGARVGGVFDLYSRVNGGSARFICSTGRYVSAAELQISPNGKHAIGIVVADGEVSRSWLQYDGFDGFDAESARNWERYQRTSRFLYIDLETGSSRPIFDAPLGTATRMGLPVGNNNETPSVASPSVLWSADSSEAILVNSALPLSEDIAQRRHTAYVVAYRVADDTWQALAPLIEPMDAGSRDGLSRRVISVDWLFPAKTLAIRRSLGHNVEQTIYGKRSSGKWTSLATRAAPSQRESEQLLKGHISAIVKQSANEPPALYATDGVVERILSDPDPALKDVRRAPVRAFQWREGDRSVEGGLVLPIDSDGRPVPLVIQAYYWLPEQFLPDGFAPVAYAAQALAAKGLAVLFMDIPIVDHPEVAETPEEGAYFVQRIDAAVSALVNERVVDPQRVGLVGFSRAGYMTYYAITHPGKTKLTAAISADGVTMSYSEYVFGRIKQDDWATVIPRIERQNGGAFWQSKGDWLVNSPGFNVDRVQTPILFTVSGKLNQVTAMETIGAFRLNQRPIDVIFLPRGEHQLQTPKERQASLQATVDWMTFWLRDGDDASLTDERRLRWSALRELQRAATREATSRVSQSAGNN